MGNEFWIEWFTMAWFSESVHNWPQIRRMLCRSLQVALICGAALWTAGARGQDTAANQDASAENPSADTEFTPDQRIVERFETEIEMRRLVDWALVKL